MERRIRLLSIALAVQVAVVALVWYLAEQPAAATKKLVDVDRNAVTAVEVAENATTSVRIEKVDGAWRLPAVDGLPADGEKVMGLISKLADADASWPVATSDASAKRFEVTDEKFTRRIRFFIGDKVAEELYLGTSPGFRKVHARRSDSSDVYAITFATYEAPAKQDDWLDKTLLQPKGKLTSLARTDGWKLDRVDDAWKLDDVAQGETTDGDAVRDVVSKVTDLRVLGRADVPPAADAKPLFELALGAEGGNSVLKFFRPTPDSDFVVATDRYPGYFRIAAYIGTALEVDHAGLVAKPKAEPVPAGAGAPAAPVAAPKAS